MTVRVGVNGFGRIGRGFLRAVLATGADVEVVAVNDLTDPATLAHLLRYDSTMGRLPHEVVLDGGDLVVGGQRLRALAEPDPARLPWGDLGVDVVVESTGRFTDAERARVHLAGGARKVLVSGPSKDPDLTVVRGVNDSAYDPHRHHVISNASCTTNCLAPLAKAVHDAFEIEHGHMTTVHAYTQDQNLLDGPHRDPRRARSAATNIIPTSTGAARAIGLVLPELAGRLDGYSLRVPVPVGSIVDLGVRVGRDVTVTEVNAALAAAADGPLKEVMRYTEDPLVSADIVGDRASCVVDGALTKVVDGRFVNVFGWYDNETGFSTRLVDVVLLLGTRR